MVIFKKTATIHIGWHWNAKMCPEHNLFHAFTKISICYCKPGGIAYMGEQHSDCTGTSSDTYLLETKRQNHGISQIFLQTVTDHNLTLKAKAHRTFGFTLTNTER